MKFNFLKRKERLEKNHEGANAYRMSPEAELYAAVVTSSVSDSFYEDSGDRIARICDLISKNKPEYVGKLAVYARTQMNMRSIPLVLAVELAKQNSGDAIVSKTVSGVVKRADEITELLAYYQTANKREGAKKLNRLSKQIQKGLGHAFNRFDEYQFAKYNRATAIKLRDALFLVHPKAKDVEQQIIFDKIANNSLATPYTWETELSALGKEKFENREQKQQAIKSKWEELIDSNKLSYMATLRNLRNILQANVSHQHISSICTYLSDKDAVANSKQLPFRFLSAYREIQPAISHNASNILAALEAAIMTSATNIAGFDEETNVLIACDVSGSMHKRISLNSSIHLFEIGLMLGMLIQNRCKRVTTGIFGDVWKAINFPNNNILFNVQEFRRREGEVGYATNGYKVIDNLIQSNTMVDKVMLFTDCQLWDTQKGGASLQLSWKTYKRICTNARLYIFDLAGYGTMPVNQIAEGVFLIAGWSDKVFDILLAMENGRDALAMVNEIEL